MSGGGGGFRGRGFGLHSHHRQGPNGPGSAGPRSNGPGPRTGNGGSSRNESPNSRINLPGVPGSRSNEHSSRSVGSNIRPDGQNARLGGTNFRGGTGTPHGPRPNFNLVRRPPRHQIRPADNWAPRGGSPHYGNWRGGRPPRFNGSPRPFYRGRGHNFNNYRFSYMGNNMGPLGIDFPPIPDSKPATPHLGSEEERLQKITEAADELKRKLSAGPNDTDVWYNDNEDDAAMDLASEEYESRIANKGIPELKHDPPELNLTLSDLRDIGRVHHDRVNEQTKTSVENASNSSYEDTEVEILDYNPVETMIEIDIWSDDNYMEHDDDESPSSRLNEQFSSATETTEMSGNTVPNAIQDKTAMRHTHDTDVTDNTDENVTHVAISNEDNQETRNGKKIIAELLREVDKEKLTDCEIEKLAKKRDEIRVKVEKMTETSKEIIQDITVENNLKPQENLRIETQEEHIEKLSEDNVNCRQTEQRNKKVIIRDKKIEDVSKKLEYVNKNDTLICSNENFVLKSNEIQGVKTSEIQDDSENAIQSSGVTDALLNGRKSTKVSTNVAESKNNSSAFNETPEKCGIAIVAEKTKVLPKQTSSENCDHTTKTVFDFEVETEIRKDDTLLEIPQTVLISTCSEKSRSLSSDNEKSKAQQQDITKKSRSALISDEIQVRKETSVDTRNEGNREESKKEVKDNDIRNRNAQPEKLSNKTNSNVKTESREKTEILRKVDVTRNTQTEKKIFDQRKSESLSSSDKKMYADNKSSTTDNKICERRKLVRKMPEGSTSPRNRKSSLAESIAKLQRSMATMDYDSCEISPIVSDRRGSSSSRPYPKKHYRNLAPVIQEPTINQQPPLVFDPRLSSQERTALLASGSLSSGSIPITQDFGMNHGYPPCPMTNFVSNVAPMNYGAPPMIGGPVEAPICLSDPYAPMLAMSSMPTTIPLPAEATMMLQPPLPVEPPPPPPPPVKSNLDMVDELEDMQEAMEFAKTFMNMGDVRGESEKSDFFHMPTFPNLPPIELPPLPPPDIPPPSAIPPPLEVPPPRIISKNIVSSSRRSVLNEDVKTGSRSIKQEPIAHESEVISDELRPVMNAAAEDASISSNESNRQKVVSKTTRLKRLEASQQKHEQRQSADERQSKNDLSTLSNDAAILATTREIMRVMNGPENREITRTDAKSSYFNGTSCFPQIRKPEDLLTNRHRSCSPRLSIRDKNSKDEESRSTPTYKEKSEQSLRRGIKDSSMKRTTDNPGTPESSWKNRVIGKFLKMSKNDICNMLNNTSLRKFDIAMKHLVKERRPSLSLGMRNNEEEKMKDADVSYDREEFMDQLNAMLDPSATVDVCNLPTQFIHHLNEVLQLDSMTDFEAALTPTDTTEIVSSTKSVQPSPSVSRARRASSVNVKEIDDHRPAKRGRDKTSMSTCDNAIEATSVATTNATPPPISIPTTVARKLSARACDDIVETRCTKNVENIVPETNTNRVTSLSGGRRRRSQTTSVDVQDTMTVNNGSSNRNETNSLNLADLDDIFSPGIVRERKKLSSVVVTPTNETRTTDFHLSLNTGSNEVMRDPSMDRVERAAVELDKIFTAGIARFKLPSTKATTAAARAVEANDDDDDDENGNWNRDDRKSNLDSGRMRQRSICRFGTRSDKWSRRKVYEDRDAFRNLTKEEWEAKYGESSYTSYEQEYRAMVGTRERKNDYEFTTEIDDNVGVKSRLGNEIPADSGSYDAWSDDDIVGRVSNANDSANYGNNDYQRSSGDSSSSSSMSSSSESSEDEPDTESVHKLLREIKAKEKIAKTKSLNEEIRDEVAAEIEKKRLEREKLRKSRHKSRPKKSHRRKKDRRVRTKDKKRKERKRRKHRSRRSESDSTSSDEDYTDEEYMSSSSRGQRLLTENEIKKEIVVKDDPECLSSPHLPRRSKSSLAIRLQDEARPPSRSSASSLPAVAVTSSTVSSPAANQPKTKAQLKQMPVVGKKSVSATIVSDEVIKAQEIPVNAPKDNASTVVTATPLTAEVPPVISVPTKSLVPASTTLSVPSVQIQPISSTTDETASSTRPTSKKLDIKAYKERNRLRQIAESDKLRQMNENPNTLTQDLLNMPLVRKNVTETTKDAVVSMEQQKQSKLDALEEFKSTIIPTTKNNATIFSKASSNLTTVCPTTSSLSIASTAISPLTIVSTTTSPLKIVSTTQSSAIIVSTMPSPVTIVSTAPSPAIIVSTTPSPAIIVSTTTSPRIASNLPSPRRIVSVTSPANVTAETAKAAIPEGTRLQLEPSRNVPPKKLIRRRSLTAAPTMSVESATVESSAEIGKFAHIKSEGRKEMKLREKLKKHRPRSVVEGLESTIPLVTPAVIKKRRSVSSDTTTDEGGNSSEKITEKYTTLPSQKAEEEQPTKASIKIKEEQSLEPSEKMTEKQATNPSENIKQEELVSSEKNTPKETTLFSSKIIEVKTMVSSEKTKAQDSAVPSDKSKKEVIVPLDKRTEEHAIVSLEKRTEETIVKPLKKETEEQTIVSSKKHAEETMVVPSENCTEECAVSNAEKSTEESMICDSEKTAPESTAKKCSEILQKSTEEPAKISEAIESNSKLFDIYKTGLKSDGLPDTVPQDYLSTMHIMKKFVVVDSQSELETFDSPITDLPDWPMESTISSNPSEQLHDSNDDPPFRGFTKDSIILNDRVLTEAEGNITELNDLRKVPLSFANDDSDASPDDVLNLDDVTSTGVSLEAPVSYGDEEFVEEGVEIETSLLGFPVASDVTDVPEAIALGTDNDVKREDKSTEKTFIEESSRQSTNLLTVVTPTLNDSPTPNDFLISNVQSQESVPSEILVTEPIRDEPNQSSELSPKDKVDEKHERENTDLPWDDAAEVSASREPENKEPASTSVLQTTELGTTMGLLQSTVCAGEKAIYNQMEKCKKISEDEENELSKSIKTEEINGEEIRSTMDSLSSNNTPVDHALTQSQRNQSNDAFYETNKETTERTRAVEESRVGEAKNKELNRGSSKSTTKEHSHNRNKRKSTRHRNHATKSDKKSALTEKMVEEAISANIVKVVPKPSSKEWVLARMIEIDVEIHKLMNEKMTLYTMLQKGEFPAKDNRDEVSDNKTNDEGKFPSEKEEAAISDIAPPTVLASHLARDLDKTALITTTKKYETKKTVPENDDKPKKRKKSPQRDIKHRSKESGETIENRRQQKNHESALKNCSEKSSSSTEHDEADENRRKSKTKLLDSSKATRRTHEHSNKEDLREASRERTDRSGKPMKHEGSPKREKSKKKCNKTEPEPGKTEESTKNIEEKSNAVGSKPTEKISAVIYSDESTWDSLDPDTIQSDEKRGPKESTTGSTGLALLEETLKREMAQTRKSKTAEKRKNKKQELRRVILDASTFLTDEAEMASNEMRDRKNARKKGTTTSSTTKGKSVTAGASSENPAKVWKHITSVIDAVAADRVEQLYTRESSPISNDSTPTTSTSGQSVESALAYERSPSISLTDSMGSQKSDSIKKATAEESKKTTKQETDSIENENEEPEVSTKSKGSKKSKGTEKNYLSESKESETSETMSASERSSPIENPKKARDLDTSLNDDKSKIQKVNILTKTSAKTKPEMKILDVKEENVKMSMSVDKFVIKSESRSSKGKETEAQVAEASRSPSPDLPSDLSRSKFHETKYRTKEKHKSEIPNLKFESTIDISPEEDELVHLSRKTDDERVRSHSRSDRSFKRRSMTPRDKERERKEKSSSRIDENNDHDEKSSSRSKSASKRRQHEKSTSSNNRNSKNSEDRSKRSRSKKRERERSNSRGDSPHEGESSRKRMHHSHRSSSPKVQSSLSDEQSRRRGRKRKRRPEISREDMMNCKVELIDCKYTYLSPEMHPRVLKKFGISRINPYVPPSQVVETVSPFEITRIDTPSPPILIKVEEPKETIEESVSPKEIHNHEEANDRPDVDDVNEDDEAEDEDGTDETIHIVKVVENAAISDQEENADVPEIIDDTSCPTDAAPPDVIAVEDETTDEMETKNYTTDEIVVVKENVSRSEKPIEKQQQSTILEAEEEEDITYETRRTRYTVHKGPILDIKVLDDSFLAASEDGAIYRYSQTSNGILNIYKGHEAAVTCINVLETSAKRWNLYSGSLDGTCRCYDITTGAQERLPADVGSPVQCMDQAWGVIFVGTKSGHISRYNIKSGSIKGDRLEFSDKSVLALKASSEGPRRVLIVASRNQPITIRDALTGLYLRTICGYKSHTVYSLMRERNLVYCGTSSTSIPVFDFTNGEQVTQYNAGVGIVCMRLYRQILFAGCYDGNIYVFDTKETKLIVSIPGPGNMLLSMEVVGDEIIAGSKDRQLHSWRMPRQVRALLAERT